MQEYEYEVKFYGKQWISTVLIYHELENTEENREALIRFAEQVAENTGLTMSDYYEVNIEHTGTLTYAC